MLKGYIKSFAEKEYIIKIKKYIHKAMLTGCLLIRRIFLYRLFIFEEAFVASHSSTAIALLIGKPILNCCKRY